MIYYRPLSVVYTGNSLRKLWKRSFWVKNYQKFGRFSKNDIILSRNSLKPNVIHEKTWKEQEKAVLEALENKISSMEKYIQASWDTTQRNYKLTSENKSIFNKLQGIFLNKINKIFFLNTVILYLRLCYGRTWTVYLGSNTSSLVYFKLFDKKK